MYYPFQAWIFPIPSGGTPPGIWGGGNQPFPTPPIHIPPGGGTGQPPGIWGGGNVPMPTPPIYGVPGAPGYQPPGGGGHPGGGAHPEHPIYWPPTPEHPIVIPPQPEVPPPDVKPEHPIVIPPTPSGVEWKMVFSPIYGWIWAFVVLPGANVPQPKK